MWWGCGPSDLSHRPLQPAPTDDQRTDALPKGVFIPVPKVVDAEPVLVTRDGPLGEVAQFRSIRWKGGKSGLETRAEGVEDESARSTVLSSTSETAG